jgi:VanZ family protein
MNALFGRQAGRIVICSSFLIILAVTLFPFNFALRGPSVRPFLATGIEDGWGMVGNIFLYVPLGFGMAVWLTHGKAVRTFWALAITGFSSLGLTFTVEMLQGFLASRSSSLVDIECNAIGALLGFACFYLWETRDGRPILLGYLILAYLISIPLQRDTLLSNWDEDFPLVLGNELTGDRPWRGSISQLHLVDRAISEDVTKDWLSRMKRSAAIGYPVLASYYLTQELHIKDRMGTLPDLVWRSEENAGGAPTETWLESESPVSYLIRRIAANSEFTLAASFASASAEQWGPARIISISRDPGHRNLTVGQEGSNLIFRLRTPMTGENGVYPTLTVPGVFAEVGSHALVAIYDGSKLTLHVDEPNKRYTMALNPGAAAASYFKPVSTPMFFYHVAYHIAIFFPFGILLSMVLHSITCRTMFRLLLAVSGTLFASLLLEGVLIATCGKTLEWQNLILSILVMGGTLSLFQSIRLIRIHRRTQRIRV